MNRDPKNQFDISVVHTLANFQVTPKKLFLNILVNTNSLYICYPFDLFYSKCWFSTDRIKQRSRV